MHGRVYCGGDARMANTKKQWDRDHGSGGLCHTDGDGCGNEPSTCQRTSRRHRNRNKGNNYWCEDDSPPGSVNFCNTGLKIFFIFFENSEAELLKRGPQFCWNPVGFNEKISNTINLIEGYLLFNLCGSHIPIIRTTSTQTKKFPDPSRH